MERSRVSWVSVPSCSLPSGLLRGPLAGTPVFCTRFSRDTTLAALHLTDLIKSRGKVGDPYPADMGPHRRIFDRELEIVQPTVIIAFGAKVYDLLQFTLAGRGITIRRVWHYAYARRGADKAKAFKRQIRNALLHEFTSH